MLLHSAKSADSFVDTIGVNTHLHFTNTVYNKFSSLIKPRLLELGVRHIRDGAKTYDGINENSFYYSRVRELANEGIQFNFITNSLDTQWGDPTDYSLLDDIYKWSNGAVTSFEAVNEPDLQGFSNWVSATQAGQRDLYQAVNSNSALNGVAVIGPSVVQSGSRDKVGDLSQWMDFGNLHNYYGVRHPETKGWGSNNYGSLKWHFDEAAKISSSDALITTETGWDNAVDANGNYTGIPKDVEAKYVPRLFLKQFNAGIDRTYLYELIDLDNRSGRRDSNLGLLNNDGSRQPSYKALRNLIDLLEDPGQSFEPDSLKFSMEGKTDGVEHTLLQKSDGRFYLAVWLGKSSWDPDARKRIDVPKQSVLLNIPESFKGATLHQFGADGSVGKTVSNIFDGKLNITVQDTVLIVELPSQEISDSSSNNSPEVESSAKPLFTIALVDADTNKIVEGYEDIAAKSDINLDNTDLGRFSLLVRINEDHPDADMVESIKFESDFGKQIENLKPYALFGDNDSGFNGRFPEEGKHTVKATAYSKDGGKGTKLSTQIQEFSFSNNDVLTGISEQLAGDPMADDQLTNFNKATEGTAMDDMMTFRAGDEPLLLDITNFSNMDDIVDTTLIGSSNANDGANDDLFRDGLPFDTLSIPFGEPSTSGIS